MSVRQTGIFGRGVAVGCLALLTGCTSVGILSGGELLEDFDSIVAMEQVGGLRSVRYRTDVERSAWYMRLQLLAPVRWPLGWLFGRREVERLDRPGEVVREILRELPWKTDGDLRLCAAATSRYAWLAELDENPEARVLGIDGLAAVCRELGIAPFAGPVEVICEPLAPDRLSAAIASLKACAPEKRGAERWTDAALEPYRKALTAVVSRPLEDWAARIALVEELGALEQNERDARARPWVRGALASAIGHCARGVLLRTVQGRDPNLADVRLCAMQQVRGLGGPEAVPLLLASMAASPEEMARGESMFDPDPYVRLRLVHYCGQLDTTRAMQVARLPGRRDWEAKSPAEFLALTVLNEQGYYSTLRTPALVALTWCLGRKTLDPDPAWVREWIESRGS